MTAGNHNEPLHRRVHWRKIRTIFNYFAQHEGISTQAYNLEKIVCYECIGNELKGINVRYNTKNNESPWVTDNNYEIFEAESIHNNHHNISGHFLVLAHNINFDYWIFAEMQHSINKEKSLSNGTVYEQVSYNIFGKYNVNSDKNGVYCFKTTYGYDCNFGHKYYLRKNQLFDGIGRKKTCVWYVKQYNPSSFKRSKPLWKNNN